jgi:hypothetical protein
MPMIAPLKVGDWTRPANAFSNVHVYTPAKAPDGWDPYDHISVPFDNGTKALAGHLHVTVRGSPEKFASFVMKPTYPNELTGSRNGPDFVYKYDFDLSLGGFSLLCGRPYKNENRPVALFKGSGQKAQDSSITVKDYSFSKADDPNANWRKTFVAKKIEAVVKQFHEDFVAAQAFYIKVGRHDPTDPLNLKYEYRKLGGGEEKSGVLSPSGVSIIERYWQDAEFRLTELAPDWISVVPGGQHQTKSGQYWFSFDTKK